jgi:hypothetical protein
MMCCTALSQQQWEGHSRQAQVSSSSSWQQQQWPVLAVLKSYPVQELHAQAVSLQSFSHMCQTAPYPQAQHLNMHICQVM